MRIILGSSRRSTKVFIAFVFAFACSVLFTPASYGYTGPNVDLYTDWYADPRVSTTETQPNVYENEFGSIIFHYQVDIIKSKPWLLPKNMGAGVDVHITIFSDRGGGQSVIEEHHDLWSADDIAHSSVRTWNRAVMVTRKDHGRYFCGSIRVRSRSSQDGSYTNVETRCAYPTSGEGSGGGRVTAYASNSSKYCGANNSASGGGRIPSYPGDRVGFGHGYDFSLSRTSGGRITWSPGMGPNKDSKTKDDWGVFWSKHNFPEDPTVVYGECPYPEYSKLHLSSRNEDKKGGAKCTNAFCGYGGGDTTTQDNVHGPEECSSIGFDADKSFEADPVRENITKYCAEHDKDGNCTKTKCKLEVYWGPLQKMTDSSTACVYYPYHYAFCDDCNYDRMSYTGKNTAKGDGNSEVGSEFKDTCPSGPEGGVRPDVSIDQPTNDPRYVLIGDPYKFSFYVTHRGGRTKSAPVRSSGYVIVVNGRDKDVESHMAPMIHHTSKMSSIGCEGGIWPQYMHGINRSSIKHCIKAWDGGSVSYNIGGSSSGSWGENLAGLDGPITAEPDKAKWLFKDAQPGDKICAYTAVDNNWMMVDDQPAATMLTSRLACIDVAKLSELRILGGDSVVRGEVHGASYNENNIWNANRGSWAQYGLIANGQVDHFGTAGYTASTKKTIDHSCYLTYANQIGLSSDIARCAGGSGWMSGKFNMRGNITSIPPLSGAPESASGSIDLSRYQGGDHVIHYSGDVKLSGSLHPRTRIIVEPGGGAGNIEIDRDISFEGGINRPFNSVAEMPSLIVHSGGDINISSEVRTMVGSYIADKRATTCSKAGESWRNGKNGKDDEAVGATSECSQYPLNIYGSLTSKEGISFYRTYGAGNKRTDTRGEFGLESASETINYTPNIYLTPYSSRDVFKDNTTIMEETSSTMLPRY